MRASDLLPNPKNWRAHPGEQREALKEILARVGYADALLARDTPEGLVLVDGHLRAETTPDQIVPVLVLDVSEAEADLLLVSLDPLAAMARTNGEALRALLGDVLAPTALLAQLQAQLGPVPSQADPDAVPPLPVGEPVTRPGDLWVLGEHRLLCGDATSGEDVARVLDGAAPELCVTDPPYGVGYEPAWRQEASEKGFLSYGVTRAGGVLNDDRVDWREAWALVPSDVLYLWHASGFASTVQDSIESAGFEVRSQLVWVKPGFAISRGHYHWRHEACWYAVRKGQGAHWVGDRKQTTVWEITLDPNVAGGHSTQKPVECMERPIRNHSGDVYDPFVGSGTTLIAAQRQGRQCYAMEINPGYCDVAVARWEAFTGGKARRG